MEVIAKTEYQDVYRISYGVLLVVNKFETFKIDGTYPYVPCDRIHAKYYNSGCQPDLKILKKDFVHKSDFGGTEWMIKSGAVVYQNLPVKLIENKDKWWYEVKITGNFFRGTKEDILGMLDEIKGVVNEQH